ncbi:MAG: hypothetical protein KA154_17970 [Gemmatimonadaceae bacterium]|nr:hypothetical protein [Gemmatimonadaceae bacterium]MCC6433105.1 hypothetical protein [Gemmatimonadaceae bacterium]
MMLALWASPMRANAQAAPASAATGRARGTVHTDTLWAQSLGIRKALTVYLPPSYATSPNRRYPVLVYLHGLGGNERNWVDAGKLDRTLDSLTATGKPEAIVVMPDGDDSWYTTWNGLIDAAVCRSDTTRREPAASYCVPWPHYDDYIAHDIIAHVDGRYRTRVGAAHRGIAGLSMGGYGAITLALAYPDVFAAAASHSGVVSPRYLGPVPFAPPPRYATTLGEMQAATRGLWKSMAPAFGRDTIAWMARDPGQLARRALTRRNAAMLPRLLIDCGVDDAYIQQNRDLHHTLIQLNVPHEYAEWPGAHTWSYWSGHAAQSLTFLLSVVEPASVARPRGL